MTGLEVYLIKHKMKTIEDVNPIIVDNVLDALAAKGLDGYGNPLEQKGVI